MLSLFYKKKKPKTSEIKARARRNLNKQVTPNKKIYVLDTSAIINKFLPQILKKGLKGKLIIPHAVMAELENMANKGREEGFLGLEQVANLHKLKNNYEIIIHFEGLRPSEMQIKFAKSGEIDALIRESARENNATLITSDLVQAKTSQAYNIPVLFLKPKIQELKKKRRLLFWKK
jgi:ATPase